ncbi:MAG: PHP domain-containing protein [Candidatus Sericytochromatia bacterium]|nr:PHP domain-containing protein [Candidatus Sericytochromatia bacterium]
MQTPAAFVHCTVQSEYSLFESTIQLRELVAQAVAYNMPALGLTDHGVLDGVPTFLQLCQDWKIQPIIGCKFLLEPLFPQDQPIEPASLTLIAKDRQGYLNLCQLVTAYQWNICQGQHILQRSLLEAHVQGLIALPAGQRGELSQYLLQNPVSSAKELIAWYRLHYELYLELQEPVSEAAKTLNQKLEELSLTEDLPLLVTHPVQCLHKGDFKSPEEMSALFQAYPEALQNSLKLAKKCHLRLSDIQNPAYFCAGLPAETESFRARVGLGLHARYATITPEIQDRLNAELKELTLQKQTKWYLFLADLCNWLKSQDLVYSTLIGNQGSLLVSYALGITDLDPIAHQISFQPRILKCAPRFTIDLSLEAIEPAQQFLREYWGEDFVAPTTVYTRSKTSNGQNRLLSGFIQSPHFFLISQQLPLRELLPLRFQNHSPMVQLHRDQIPALGFYTLQLLEHEPLTHLQKALKSLKQQGLLQNVNQIPTDDPKVFAFLSTEAALNLYWLNGDPESLNWLEQFRPTCLNELADLIALYRPRPLEAGLAQLYLERKQGKVPLPNWLDAHESLQEFLTPTQGVVIYLDQLIELLQTLAEFNTEQAEEVRSHLFKQDERFMEEVRMRFLLGTERLPDLADKADEIYKTLIFQAKTSFSRTHALGTALTLYRCAWVRYNYPFIWGSYKN